MKKNKSSFIYLAAISYAIIIGLSFLFNKIAISHSNPLDVLAHRFTAAFIGVIILLLFKDVKINYTWERVKKILPLALLYPLSFFSFQTFGLQYASSSEAGILMASAPIFTLILAGFFLKEKTNFLQKLSIIISVSGVIYITIMKGASFDFANLKGVLFLVLSALSMAGYSVLARVLTRDFSNIELSVIMLVLSFIAFNALAVGNHLVAGTLNAFLTPILNKEFLLCILYLGILSSLISSLLSNFVLSKIEASKMSVFSNLGTVISMVAGVVFLKEDLFYYHIIGSILIVIGVLGTNFLDHVHLKGKK